MKKLSVILISLVMLVVAVFPATAAQVPAETTTQAYTTAPTESYDWSIYEGAEGNVPFFDIHMSGTTANMSVIDLRYVLVYVPADHTIKLFYYELVGNKKVIKDSSPEENKGFNAKNTFLLNEGVSYKDCTVNAETKKLSISYGSEAPTVFISISDNDACFLTCKEISATPFEETTSAPVVEQTTSAPVVEQTTSAPVVEQNKNNSFSDWLMESIVPILIVLAVLVVLLLAACIVLIILLINAKNSTVAASVKTVPERKTAAATKTNQPQNKKSGAADKSANKKGKNVPNAAEAKKTAVIEAPEAVSVVKEVEAPAPEVIVPVKTFIETAKESLAVAYQSGSLPSISHKFAQIESYMTKLSGKPIIKEYDGSQSYFIFFSDPETGKMYLLPNPNYYNEKKCSFLLTKPGISDFIGVTGAENNGIIIGTVPSEIIKEGQDTYVVVKKGLIAWQ